MARGKKERRWQTNDGRDLTPREFEAGHLVNTIAFIERKAAEVALKYGTKKTKEEVIDLLWPVYKDLVAELNRRISESEGIASPISPIKTTRRFTLKGGTSGQDSD